MERMFREKKDRSQTSELMSYFSDRGNMCWFLEPELASSIQRVHGVVENVVAGEDTVIMVGTRSTQLTQAVLYALSSSFDDPEPVSVVCAAPYYSANESEYLRPRLYKWGGDARTFTKDGTYIEMVTSRNNPDETMREAVVKKKGGLVVHDLAYYWPQYIPICTGHAGSRIGWDLVKDKCVVARMIKFMECNSIDMSRESQLRVGKILKHISHDCMRHNPDNFFEFGRSIMVKRWERLREIVKGSDMFNFPKYPSLFTGEVAKSHTGFAWLECKKGIDLESVFREHKILTIRGARFG